MSYSNAHNVSKDGSTSPKSQNSSTDTSWSPSSGYPPAQSFRKVFMQPWTNADQRRREVEALSTVGMVQAKRRGWIEREEHQDKQTINHISQVVRKERKLPEQPIPELPLQIQDQSTSCGESLHQVFEFFIRCQEENDLTLDSIDFD
eukprot:53454-Hanusia_phi.AAC.1